MANPHVGVLDGTLAASLGSSGGPIWITEGTAGNPEPTVVEIVSTSGWAAQLTTTDL